MKPKAGLRETKTVYPGWQFRPDLGNRWKHTSGALALDPYRITNTGIPEDAFEVPPMKHEVAQITGCLVCGYGQSPCDPERCARKYHDEVQARIYKPMPDPQTLAGSALLANEMHQSVSDPVNLPDHYGRFKIEPVRYATENDFNGFQFNINKYMARAPFKHPTPFEDISKVIRYAEMWYDFELGDPDWWKPRGHATRRPFSQAKALT